MLSEIIHSICAAKNGANNCEFCTIHSVCSAAKSATRDGMEGDV